MSNRTRPGQATKLNRTGKTALSALSLVALLGGWNVIGHREAAANNTAELVTLPAPATWTALPQLAPAAPIRPLATLPSADPRMSTLATGSANIDSSTPAFDLPALPALAPIQALAPLPAVPPMPARPAAPGRSRGGHKTGSS